MVTGAFLRIVRNDHSQDPARKTDGALIATAYYLKVLQLMHRFAQHSRVNSRR